ncbi:TetR/AcrR family transcriptional regulator [Streptomyces ipomoeae]|uniref:TetR/AcrR family transcriptional regulator n=1 Tax=Streptomyces ipomoeae TaxID=103232 RepID=UPI00114665A2|nr:TetR/AcrR family transcriptional regulator [Streptomyces ipomoeae]MDX2939315.1 TetR/AcrR family transcriptional regulator [Streptomyces ipomoeae]TQE29277.1 TetR/AcrR family transcriptional regulator [Streptomyces ipomoeae]
MKSQVKRVPNVRGEGERLRQEILDAATRILEETGREDALTLRGLAREVGISAPSVYRHFNSKADLVSTILDATYRALAVVMSEAGESAAAAGADPWGRVRATVTAYRRFAVDKPRRYRLMFGLEYVPEHRPSTDDPIDTVLQAWTDTVDAYLAEAAPGRRAEAQNLGVHLWTALHGQLALWRTLPGPVAGSEDILIELEESLLRCLLPTSQAPSATQ